MQQHGDEGEGLGQVTFEFAPAQFEPYERLQPTAASDDVRM